MASRFWDISIFEGCLNSLEYIGLLRGLGILSIYFPLASDIDDTFAYHFVESFEPELPYPLLIRQTSPNDITLHAQQQVSNTALPLVP